MDIARGYLRIVIGERGPYIEFDRYQIVAENLHMPHDQEWRKTHNAAYYLEYRTRCSAAVMIYYQKKLVDYADYRLGYFYIDPEDLTCDQHHKLISPAQGKLFEQ